MLFFITIAYSLAQTLIGRLAIPAYKLFIILIPNVLLLVCFTSTTADFIQQAADTTTILLTEVFYDTPAVDSEQEWVELANFGPAAIDLSDYKLGDEEQTQGKEGMLRFPIQTILSPGQTIIVAQSARGFRTLYGRNPDYEIAASDPQVPDMRRYTLWSAGDFALANDGDELLLLDGQNRLIDSINYGDKTTYFDPAISSVYTGQSIERVPASCDTDSAADWQPSRLPAPGALNLEGECVVSFTADPDQSLLSIGQIQGAGDISPFVNQRVEFRGLVTGSLEDRNSAGTIFYTLFLQDIPGQEDGDPRTSDGMAVFLGRQRPSYQIGDLLHISGLVTEFYGLTEIDDQDLQIKTTSHGHPFPEPMPLDLPQEPGLRRQYLESHESMFTTLADPARVVGPTHPGCGFALVDSYTDQDPKPRRRTEDVVHQPMLVLYNSDVDCRDLPDVKIGDLVSGVSGPLTYHFDQYKIVLQNSAPLQVSSAPWPALPLPFQPAANQFVVATFNLNNHFDGTKDMPSSAEPVIAAAALETKQTKLAVALGETLGCPTIVGIQEVESESLLQSLVKETAVICGFTYVISHHDSSDSRGLDLALLTDPRRIEILSIILHQACTAIETGVRDPDNQCPSPESPLFGRPPLQVDLQLDGILYTVYINHFKSKREGEEETAARRLQQAQHIASLINAQLAIDPQVRIITLGDFNDYEQSPTMLQMIGGANLVNVLERLPLEDRYTYIFDGVPQLIDGILVSTAVLPYIADAMIVHSNAGYPVGLASDTSVHGLPFHATDHDLPLLLLNLPHNDRPLDIDPTTHSDPTQPAALNPKQPAAPDPTATSVPPSEPSQPSVTMPLLWPVFLIILAVLALLLLYLWKM